MECSKVFQQTKVDLACESGWTLNDLGGESFCWITIADVAGPNAKSECADRGAKVPLPKRFG